MDRSIYSPLLWDVNPKSLARFLKNISGSAFQAILKQVRGARPGTDLTADETPVTLQAISGGNLPSYRVKSTGGPRVYGFAPYTGTLLTSDGEKTVLDKARALVSCLKVRQRSSDGNQDPQSLVDFECPYRRVSRLQSRLALRVEATVWHAGWQATW